jgi:hypothetical protein
MAEDRTADATMSVQYCVRLPFKPIPVGRYLVHNLARACGAAATGLPGS